MQLLPEIDPAELAPLNDMLEMITIPQSQNNNRKGFGHSRSVVFGIRRARIKRDVGLSAFTKKYPEIWEEIKRVGDLFPCKYTSVYLNKNVECDWHRDVGNVGNTWIVSFGDYEGCNLEVEGIGEVDTNCRPVKFDGKAMLHRTTPLVSGTKYSLVFYCHECAYK
jgi:hypothetical protein